MGRKLKVHYLRQGKRATACGRPAKATKEDTRIASRVTCEVCKHALDAWHARLS